MGRSNSFYTAKSYNKYYGDGLYDDRYPEANQNVAERILVHVGSLPETSIVLDFGCGSGRYIQKILQYSQGHVYGFDISETAIHQATHRLRFFRHRVSLFSLRDSLEGALQNSKEVDVAILLFGVLAHIRGKNNRIDVLSWLFHHLGPGYGHVLVSVPNRKRRFWWLQFKSFLKSEDGIIYHRGHGQKKVSLYYHLYSCKELIQELESVGFLVQRVSAESFLPESWVTRFHWFARLDKSLCQRIPAWMGYGILVEARRPL